MEAEDGAERPGQETHAGPVAEAAAPDRASGQDGPDADDGALHEPTEGSTAAQQSADTDGAGDDGGEPPDQDEGGEDVRRGVPVTTGIGCAALLLPVLAVIGAVVCFAAGILSAASGCSPNGSALCSSSGPWIAFALPLFVAPLIAAATAITAVLVRRHRSTWLAVGYGVVFVSIIVGLAVASTGSN